MQRVAWKSVGQIKEIAMAIPMIRVLHVEDDLSQRRYVAHHLGTMPDYRFDMSYAEDEDGALVEFNSSPADLVLLDYQLKHGDGLSCLTRLRRLDPIVPIIAISGMASQEIAAVLLQAGADDYIDKVDVSSLRLAENLGRLLARATACRNRISKSRSAER
jgi:DNA-binding response OmpR family regulator